MNDWLWAIGQLGVAYGCYRWWKRNKAFIADLEVASQVDLNKLQDLSETTVNYGIVEGLVQANDVKSQSILTSQFSPECDGVIHRLTTHEKKFEKFSTIWIETKSLLSDLTRYVSFRLVSPKGDFIVIDNPLKFHSIYQQLEVTHIKFDVCSQANPEKLAELFVGRIAAGLETKEAMLLVNVPLTGIGRLEKRSGIWYLMPHKQWGGILTKETSTQVLFKYRTFSNMIHALSIIFGIAAGCTTIYLIYRYYLKCQQRTSELQTIDRPIENSNRNTHVHCVACFENEVIYNIQPCSHLGLCHSCMQELQSRISEQQLCPVCRAPIRQYQRLYLA